MLQLTNDNDGCTRTTAPKTMASVSLLLLLVLLLLAHITALARCWPVGTDGVMWSVGHDREPCKNGTTDRDAVRDVELGGPKKAFIKQSPDLHT